MSAAVAIGVQLAAGFLGSEMHRGLGLVQKFLNAKHDVELMQMVEVARDPFELARCVIVQRGGDVDLVTLDGDLHGGLLV